MSGPPDKFSFIDTMNKTPTDVANELSVAWERGYTGPYVVVGSIIYIGAYPDVSESK